MIPNGAQLITHFTAVDRALEKSSNRFFVAGDAALSAIPKIHAHARIPI